MREAVEQGPVRAERGDVMRHAGQRKHIVSEVRLRRPRRRPWLMRTRCSCPSSAMSCLYSRSCCTRASSTSSHARSLSSRRPTRRALRQSARCAYGCSCFCSSTPARLLRSCFRYRQQTASYSTSSATVRSPAFPYNITLTTAHRAHPVAPTPAGCRPPYPCCPSRPAVHHARARHRREYAQGRQRPRRRFSFRRAVFPPILTRRL